MKISFVIESDNMEEFHRALVLLGQSAGPTPTATLHKAAAVVAELEAAQPPKPKPVPTEPKPVPTEPDEPEPAAVVAEAPPAPAEAPVEAKKGRGRPRKAPVAETGAAPVAVAPVAAPPAPVNGPTVGETPREALGHVFGAYVRRYGTGVGYSDVSKILTDTFGPGIRKQSDLPDEHLPKAIAVVAAAIESNPFQRRRADVQ